MYLDAPGEYFHRNGAPASEEAAEAAGFEVAKWRRERDRMEARRAALEMVEAQFREEMAKADAEIAKKAEPANADGRLAPVPGDEGRAQRVLNGRPLPRDFQKITPPPSQPPSGPDDPRWQPLGRFSASNVGEAVHASSRKR
jgi:hypothetical protein